jgi:septum formation protein
VSEAPLILASASKVRAEILSQAGVPFRIEAADIDEGAIKRSHKRRRLGPDVAARALAAAKAGKIAKRHPGALVLGADQILACDGVWFDKPADLAEAKTQLMALRGRSHDLITAACIIEDGRLVWEHVETSTLGVRPFSSPFLTDYLDHERDHLLSSVGAYRLEGMGAQLFARIDGDHFAILGLPLLPLLKFLRWRGLLED